MIAAEERTMENKRKLMQFFFIRQEESSVHYHQDLEIIYVMKGKMEIKIDESVYQLQKGDFILINANKRHSCVGTQGILAARFFIDFHILAEHMGTLQLMFWCNTVVDRNDAYEEVRKLLDRILSCCSDQEEKGALYLNSLYYELLYHLVSYFMVKADQVWTNQEDSRNQIRVRQIQNYIQANYQTQISLNDLAQRLYLSNVYLSKYIKKHIGLTFLEYLNNVRLFHAVDELLYTNKSITRIAMDNGFPTSAAFIKSFRSIHREAPSQYRKRMQQNMPPVHQEYGLEEKSLDLVHEYLRNRQTGQQENGSRQQIYTADASYYEIQNADWTRAVNVGEAYTLLQSEVQDQLIQIQQETGMRYARIWNLLSRKQCADEKGGMNFRKLDLVLDFIIDHRMKPYIELGGGTEVKEAEKDGTKRKETWDYELFCEMIRAFYLHLINRYGLEEIEGWYFEFGKASGLGMTAEDGAYYQAFEAICRIFKEIAPEIRVGGAGLLLGYENSFFRKIFRIWKKRKFRPDFLSFRSCQDMSIAEDELIYGRKSIDSSYMKNQMQLIRDTMEEEDFQIPEIHIVQWNFTDSNRNVFNDSSAQGAYIVKTCISMLGNADFMGYWQGLDIGSDYAATGVQGDTFPAGQESIQQGHSDITSVLNGDSGLITRDGIRKPSFYAFQFMNKLQSHVVCRNENSVVTANGRGRFTAVCHNYKSFSSKYAFCKEEEIQIDEMDQFVEDMEPLRLKICLKNVNNGTYQVKSHYVNHENGSVQNIWKMMGYEKVLAKDEIEYLKRRAIPSMEIRTVQATDGTLELEHVMQPQEIRLLDIWYRY